jgi:hypothetical protein
MGIWLEQYKNCIKLEMQECKIGLLLYYVAVQYSAGGKR